MTRAAWIAVGGLGVAAVGLLIALVVAIAASGDDDSGLSDAPPQVVGGDPGEMEEFQACMEEHGVERPDPGEGGVLIGPDEAEDANEAFEACRELLPEEAAPPVGAPGMPGLQIRPGG